MHNKQMTQVDFSYTLRALLNPFQLDRDIYHTKSVYKIYCEPNMGLKVLIKNIKSAIMCN